MHAGEVGPGRRKSLGHLPVVPQLAAPPGDDDDDVHVSLKMRVGHFLATTPWGFRLDAFNFVVATLSCCVYVWETYETNFHSSRKFDLIELPFIVLFSFDYSLRLLLAQRRLAFVCSPHSLTDLVTILPVPLSFGTEYDPEDAGTLESAVRFLRTLRLLRVLHGTRMIPYMRSQVTQIVAHIVLTVFAIGLCTAGVVQFVEFDQGLPFHDWLYFIVITISTVGTGDVTADSSLGRLVVVLMIAISIFTLPKQTNALVDLMSNTSKYARRIFRPLGRPHVLICGKLNANTLSEVFTELFHADHGDTALMAVVLSEGDPSYETDQLLRSPELALRVTYLAGSPLVDNDLLRASAHSADACFVLTNKFSEQPDEEDAATILRALAVQRFYAERTGEQLTTWVQLIREQNVAHVPASLRHSVICMNTLKMSLLAKTCIFPGLSTLVSNLIASDAGLGADGEEDDLDSSAQWVQQYVEGAGYEIYGSPLPPFLTKMRFSDAALLVRKQLGTTLFAVELTPPGDTSRVLLNPGHMRIPDVAQYQVTGFVMAQDSESAFLLGLEPPAPEPSAVQLDAAQAQALAALARGGAGVVGRPRAGPGPGAGPGSGPAAPDSPSTPKRLTRATGARARRVRTASGNNFLSETPKEKARRRWRFLARLIRGEVTLSAPDAAELDLRKEYFVDHKLSRLADVTVHRSLAEELPGVTGHLIVAGSVRDLYNFVLPLRAKYIGEVQTIVVLHPHPLDAVWGELMQFTDIAVVQGSPLDETDLLRAGADVAQTAIVLAKPFNASDEREEALADADSIFTFQALRRINPAIHVVVEMANRAAQLFLHTRAHERLNEISRSSVSPHTMAGTMFSPSVLDTLICQAYHNPHIAVVLDRLVAGTSFAEQDWKPTTIASLGNVKEGHLFQLRMPRRFHRRPYEELFCELAERYESVPLALLRCAPGMSAAEVRYVVTHPPPDLTLDHSDAIFLLAPSRPSIHDDVDLQVDGVGGSGSGSDVRPTVKTIRRNGIRQHIRAARRRSMVFGGATDSGGDAAAAAALDGDSATDDDEYDEQRGRPPSMASPTAAPAPAPAPLSPSAPSAGKHLAKAIKRAERRWVKQLKEHRAKLKELREARGLV